MSQSNKNQYVAGLLSGISVASVGFSILLLSSGFQGQTLKIGTVDANNVIAMIEQNKGSNQEIDNFVRERENVLEYLNRYRVLSKADAEKFKNLSLKVTKTDAEKAELEKIKSSAQDMKKKLDDLQLKPNPSPEELKLLEEYRNKQAEIGEYLSVMNNEFLQDSKAKNETIVRAKVESYLNAVKDIAKKQQYTLILERGVAPYAANDISEDVVKAVMKKP